MMDDFTAPRIEPLGQSNDHEAYPPRKRPATKEETPKKPSPLPPLLSRKTRLKKFTRLMN